MIQIARTPTTLDLLLMSPTDLLANYNIQKDERVHWTGHHSRFAWQWTLAIGAWAGDSSESSPVSPLTTTPHTKMSRVRQFEFTHRLLSAGEFRALHGPQPWRRAELCFARVHEAFDRLGSVVPLGIAALAVVEQGARHTHSNLGMLPVEIVLWSRVFSRLCIMYGITFPAWRGLAERDRLDH